jgi:hypothetical protein
MEPGVLPPSPRPLNPLPSHLTPDNNRRHTAYLRGMRSFGVSGCSSRSRTVDVLQYLRLAKSLVTPQSRPVRPPRLHLGARTDPNEVAPAGPVSDRD